VKHICNKLSVEKGEVYGLYHVMLWLKDQNVDNVIFELDSENVVDCFNSINDDVFELGC